MKNTLHCKSQLKRARAAPNVPVWESLPCIVSYLDNLRLLSNLQSWGLTRVCVCVWQREEQTEKGFTLHAAGVIPDNFILNSFQLSWRSSVHPGHYFNIFPVLQFIAVSWFFNHYLYESFHSTPAHLHSLFFFTRKPFKAAEVIETSCCCGRIILKKKLLPIIPSPPVLSLTLSTWLLYNHIPVHYSCLSWENC